MDDPKQPNISEKCLGIAKCPCTFHVNLKRENARLYAQQQRLKRKLAAEADLEKRGACTRSENCICPSSDFLSLKPKLVVPILYWRGRTHFWPFFCPKVR